MKRITLLGAGLAGTLMSLFLARRGYQVDLFESRPDLRVSSKDYGRSINLALSCRGITGLNAMDLMNDVEKIMVPMRARAIHEENGEIKYQPFGRHENEYINAIQRTDLNALLLNKAEESPLINLYFDVEISKIDIHGKNLYFLDKNATGFNHRHDHLIAADGAASMVRETLKQEGLIEASREFLPHGYKELSISTTHGVNMAREHLHIWPRNSFMLLGNPNLDDSITGSLFLANHGEKSFESLNTEECVNRFFKKEFSDVYEAMPHLVEEFFNHPIGHLSTIKCAPWYYKDECLLIGDAAHGIVPFFGQGMNCAFEDCRIFDLLLDNYADDWSKAIPAFYQERKINTEAVAAMSMDNYHEIQTDIIDSKFNLRKQIEHELMKRYPEQYISKHVLVMFTNTPYAMAKAYGEVQDELLRKICSDINSFEEVNWKKVNQLMIQYDKKLANISL
ncbi:FAD-dependent monooxygenase [Legionella israelensis]|uniref:FAD-dependent oxidoreductase n=1 Tax=Legionella israelensis TaxID=454 RepID=UPI00117D3FED|nr:NAD(P)/FAD-dependent oxidoreductase [Legionella israelensis]QDP73002.1 FAD-dependent monooxygenase [Legionella israelensis]